MRLELRDIGLESCPSMGLWPDQGSIFDAMAEALLSGLFPEHANCRLQFICDREMRVAMDREALNRQYILVPVDPDNWPKHEASFRGVPIVVDI